MNPYERPRTPEDLRDLYLDSQLGVIPVSVRGWLRRRRLRRTRELADSFADAWRRGLIDATTTDDGHPGYAWVIGEPIRQTLPFPGI